MKILQTAILIFCFCTASVTSSCAQKEKNEARYGGEHYALTKTELEKLITKEKRGDKRAGRRLYLYYSLFLRDGVAARKYEKYIVGDL